MPSRRVALIGFGAVLAIGLIGLLLAGITTKSDVVQSLGVNPIYAVAPLHPNGGTVCEDPIAVSDPIENVRFSVGTHGKPGVPMNVTIYRSQGPQISQGVLSGGWVDNGQPQEVPVPRVASGQLIKVCLTNVGSRWAYGFGDLGVPPDGVEFPSGPRPTITPADATVDGVGIGGDVSMAFVTDQPRSLLTRIPEAFQRASAFRPGFVGPWLYWLLLACILIGAPLAIGRALVLSLRGPREPESTPPKSNGHGPSAAATVEPLRQPEDTAATSRGSRD
jgi:hypothetical protein